MYKRLLYRYIGYKFLYRYYLFLIPVDDIYLGSALVVTVAPAMSDSNNSNNLVDLTGPDELAKKVPKLLIGFFGKYDPSDPAQVQSYLVIAVTFYTAEVVRYSLMTAISNNGRRHF